MSIESAVLESESPEESELVKMIMPDVPSSVYRESSSFKSSKKKKQDKK